MVISGQRRLIVSRLPRHKATWRDVRDPIHQRFITGTGYVDWMVAGHSLTRMVNHAAVKEERTSFVIERAFMHTILICTGIAKRTQGLNLRYYHQFSLPHHHCQHTSGQKSVIDNDDYGEYTSSSRGFSMICGTFTLSWSSLTHIGYVVERAFPSRFVDFSLQ